MMHFLALQVSVWVPWHHHLDFVHHADVCPAVDHGVTTAAMLEENYRFGIDSFFKDFKTPPDGISLMVDQLA